ncbi:MAG: hypothetical protein KHX56_06430 [Clostridiales bacterium]|nr:hypothetical protein [Clostridiales bacterium]
MPKILSSNGLKLIAAVSMTVDHIGAALFPQALWLRCIGRLAFVLYAFLITEGYIYTRNVKWYMARLGLLAVLSEVPFDLLFHRSLFYPYAQNVFFTLFLGLLAIYLMDLLGSRLAPGMWFLCLIPVGAACVAAGWLQCDYRYYGVLMIAVFFACKSRYIEMFLGVAVISMAMNTIQLWGITAMLPISLYNGKKGKGSRLFTWLFYFYYPVHMLLIFGIAATFARSG